MPEIYIRCDIRGRELEVLRRGVRPGVFFSRNDFGKPGVGVRRKGAESHIPQFRDPAPPEKRDYEQV